MSNAETNVAGTALLDDPHAEHGGNGHDPNLAHHFDTPEQQYTSAKLGMWIFLGTELLMFGGLFCAYSVYRHNHPEVFVYAHKFLDKWLGAVNTVVLITSSLTMAWAVRASQMNKSRLLTVLLILTIIGGYGFLGIKSIEYHQKYEHGLWFGGSNIFSESYIEKVGPKEFEKSVEHLEHTTMEPSHAGGEAHAGEARGGDAHSEVIGQANGEAHGEAVAGHEAVAGAAATSQPTLKTAAGFSDPNAGLPDEAKIKPSFESPAGLAPEVAAADPHHHHLSFEELALRDKKNLATFFNIYFFMTGLHGVHVVVGMSLIYWVLLRSVGPRGRLYVWPLGLASVGVFLLYLIIITHYMMLAVWGGAVLLFSLLWLVRNLTIANSVEEGHGEFSRDYFTPVDLVGLYWHLVDLIWIFLFPLLYLIH